MDEQIFERQAECGDVTAMVALARIAMAHRDYARAGHYLRLAGDQGKTIFLSKAVKEPQQIEERDLSAGELQRLQDNHDFIEGIMEQGPMGLNPLENEYRSYTEWIKWQASRMYDPGNTD